jgi:hypothetical protein
MRFSSRRLWPIGLLIAGVFAATPIARAFDLGKLMGYGSNDPTLDTFKLIHVEDVKSLMQDGKSAVHLYDANDAAVRARYGTIPGAVQLPSDDKYPLTMLPDNKQAKLVFYCTNWL